MTLPQQTDASATRNRGPLPGFLTTTDVARLLNVKRQRVHQLVDEGVLQPPYLVGRERVWSADDIQLDLAERIGDPERLPLPCWETIAVPTPPLGLAIDEVADIPLALQTSETRQVHVRIWRGPAGGRMRTVIVVGALRESRGTLRLCAEVTAAQVAARHLRAEEARTAWWFNLWPRGAAWSPRTDEAQLEYVSFRLPRARRARGGLLEAVMRRGAGAVWSGEFGTPIWRPVDRGALTRALGREPEIDYPPGNYTAAVVRQLAAGVRPVRQEDIDPAHLAPALRRLTVLRGYAAALQAEPPPGPRRALALLAAADGHEAARCAEALRVGARLLAPAAAEILERYEQAQAAAESDPGAHLVQRRWYVPTGEERQVLTETLQPSAAVADREGEVLADLSPAAVTRALARLRAVHRRVANAVHTGAEGADRALAEALEAAEQQLVSARHLLDPAAVDDPDPEPVVIAPYGAAEESYLTTVGWYGPKPEHRLRADRLRDYLWERDREAARLGYDAFGRLVWQHTEGRVLVVERPRALPSERYPDEAELLATAGAGTVFVRLPDGRVDILPTDPRTGGSAYLEWGARPQADIHDLCRAVAFAVLDHPEPGGPLGWVARPDTIREHIERLLTSTPQQQPLHLTVGAVRGTESAPANAE